MASRPVSRDNTTIAFSVWRDPDGTEHTHELPLADYRALSVKGAGAPPRPIRVDPNAICIAAYETRRLASIWHENGVDRTLCPDTTREREIDAVKVVDLDPTVYTITGRVEDGTLTVAEEISPGVRITNSIMTSER